MSIAHIKFTCPHCRKEIDIRLDVGYDLVNYPVIGGAFEREDWCLVPYEMSKALNRMQTILSGAGFSVSFEVEPVTESERRLRGIE